jgi:hypothetical protein
VAAVKRKLGRSVSTPGTGGGAYDLYTDVNADGRINALDVAEVKKNLAHALPAGGPPLAAGAGAAGAGASSVTRELFGTELILA